jgi:hypothetical protein
VCFTLIGIVRGSSPQFRHDKSVYIPRYVPIALSVCVHNILCLAFLLCNIWIFQSQPNCKEIYDIFFTFLSLCKKHNVKNLLQRNVWNLFCNSVSIYVSEILCVHDPHKLCKSGLCMLEVTSSGIQTNMCLFPQK